MDPATVRGLTNSQWVAQHLNVSFTGPTGIGKALLGQVLPMAATPHECTGGRRNALPHERQPVPQKIFLPFELLHQINRYSLGARHAFSPDNRRHLVVDNLEQFPKHEDLSGYQNEHGLCAGVFEQN